MSTFVIGDIHGRLGLLNKLLGSLPMSADDKVVFIGDYVDRGPDSKGVVERVMTLKEDLGERCVCLLGNHEDMMLDHLKRTREAWDLAYLAICGLDSVSRYGDHHWLVVGGNATRESYDGEVPIEHVAFLAGLPLIYEEEEMICVHAGLNARGATPRGQMLWGAPGFWSDLDPLTGRPIKGGRRSFGKIVVVGHTCFDQPLVLPDVIGIDTGAGHGGPLTALQFPEMRFIQTDGDSVWTIEPEGLNP